MQNKEAQEVKITPKAALLLEILEDSSISDTYAASVIASRLWPEKYESLAKSCRRVGLARTAGGFASKLEKKGLVRHWMDDCTSGYFITTKGKEALAAYRKGRPSDRLPDVSDKTSVSNYFKELDLRMKNAGMASVDSIIEAHPLGLFATHTGVKDLESFENWLKMEYRSMLYSKAKIELDRMEGKQSMDELYDWYLAHASAFGVVLANFRKATGKKP